MADVEGATNGDMSNSIVEHEESSLKTKTTVVVNGNGTDKLANGYDDSGASHEDSTQQEGPNGTDGASESNVMTPDSATPAKSVVNGAEHVAVETTEHVATETQQEVVATVTTTEVNVDVSTQNVAKEEPGVATGPPVETAADIDDIVPSDKIFTWLKDEAVKLRIGEGITAEKPTTVVTELRRTAKRCPNRIALAVKRDANKDWLTWTYAEYLETVRRTAKAFIKLGLEPYCAVGIIGFNSPEWFFSDLGAIWAGGFACGIYTTNTPEACHFVASNCEANIIVVENDAQLQKILKVEDRLPCLKAIVQYTGEPSVKRDNIYSWGDLMKIGDEVGDGALEERLKLLAPNKCCTLIYTSGTTGNPKGVMVNHDNITFTARRGIELLKLELDQDSMITYLPLSHIAAQLMDLHAPIIMGCSVYFAQPDALKGSLGKTLKDVRPSMFLGVPRVWEKMQETLKGIAAQSSGIKKKIGAWAKDKGYRANVAKMNKDPSTPFGYGIANKLVFRKLKVALGLDRCRICFSAAAPIMKETLEYFMSLDIPIFEIYGMSECTGPHTCCSFENWRICTVGKEIPGLSTVLHNKDEEGNGEICMRGRHVFMGYLNNEEKTREALDDDGLLHSGDIGRYDKDGFLTITGRIKELIITAGGENVPPVYIEDNVKEALPCVSGCMLVGDKRKFLSLLITIKTEVDPNTSDPLDQFQREALEWCKTIGSQSTCVADVLDNKDPVFLKAIQEGIDRANKKAASNAQRVAKWTVLPKDFSVPGGELGPTLKLKRPVVHKQYTDTIDAFYA